VSESNVQLIRDHFAAKDKLDREAIRSQLTDDAKWWVPLSGAKRGIAVRPMEGGDHLADILTGTLSLKMYSKERSWTIEHVVADSHIGAAQVHLVTTLAATGTPYENTYVYFFRFVDGKIAEFWEHLDTAYAFELFDAGAGD
jgi:ketosteroid isomerase-like protein